MSDQRETSSNFGQSIQATRFETPAPPGSKPEVVDRFAKPQAPWWHSQFNLMICVFVLLAVAALLFTRLTPPPELTVGAPDAQPSAAATAPATQAAPWDESRRAQARSDAQDILSALLASKERLERAGVKAWAPAKFEQALAKAEQGDEQYKLQDYQQALASYQAAADGLDALFSDIPKLVEREIGKANDAIIAGKSALATASFKRALELDQDNLSALEGLARAEKLDEVLGLNQAALAAQQQHLQDDSLQHLHRAQELLEQAIAIDPAYQKSKDLLAKVNTLITDKQFRSAMTEGFSALFAGRYSAANGGFADALNVRPDDAMAKIAYSQSLAANKTSSLQSLLNRAARLEQSEQWQGALANYESVLQRDANMVAARLGQIRSRARAELDRQLRELLADPLALSKSGQAKQARAVLADAKAIRDRGPLLQSQIDQLENGMQLATAEVKVRLISDQKTQVSLRKAGASRIDLGRFSSRNLALQPGRYVLTGIRLGYQDQRIEIELLPSSSVQSFSVRCDTPVSNSLAVGKS